MKGPALPSFLADRPLWLAFSALYVIATARGQLTYWLARVASERATRRVLARDARRIASRVGGAGEPSADDATAAGAAPRRLDGLARWLDGRGVGRGRRAIERWGPAAVPLSYLTVGFQTLVLASAGAMRIGWLRFSLAQIPGALGWALIYTTIGWAAWEAGLSRLAGRG